MYVEATNIKVVNQEEITATITLPACEPTESAFLDVANDYEQDDWFPVQIAGSPAPTITDVKPSTWFAGKTYDSVVIKGTGFTTEEKATANCPVTPVSITAADGSAVPVSNVNVVNKTKITLTVAPPVSNPTDPTQTATVTVGTATFNPAYILGNQILCDPSMNCNPTVISTTDGSPPPVQSVVVGQPIILTTNPNLPITPYKTTWTVGGTKIKGYAPTAASGSVTKLTEADLKNSEINYYWVYTGTDLPVTYQYCATIPDVGNQCSPIANASFNVTGPGDAQMATDAYGAVVINRIVDRQPCLPVDLDPYLQYGVVTGYDDSVCPDLGGVIGNPPGIKFTQPEASSRGKYSFVQIVNKDTVKYFEGENGSLSCPTNPGLDSVYPYTQFPDGTTSDSPSVLLEPYYSKVSRTFKATMYLLWTSNKPGSIPVPISSQSWQFTQASAINSGYSTNQSWTQPIWNEIGKDGDPVDYVQTAPSTSPYGYPTWKGTATPIANSVCPTQNSEDDEEQQEEEQ